MEITALIFLGFGLVFAIAIYGTLSEKQRMTALEQVSDELNFVLHKGRNHQVLANFPRFALLRHGNRRYAANVVKGTYRQRQFTAFDYHYENYSNSHNGRQRTRHHYHACFVCKLPYKVGELRVRPENLVDVLASVIGLNDIQFHENEAFSKAYYVKARDKAFARRFFTPAMQRFFMEHRGLVFEIDGDAMMLSTHGRVVPEKLTEQMALLDGIYRSMEGEQQWSGQQSLAT